MAINFSSQYVANAREKVRLTPLYFKMKLYHVVRLWRKFRLRFSPRTTFKSEAECFVTENFDRAAPHFQDNKWAFVEDVLSQEFHRELCDSWPEKCYFDPPRDLEKSYNRGFFWYRGEDSVLRRYDPKGRYPQLSKFLNYFNSAEFAARVENFVGGRRKLSLYSFILTDAGSGSEVIPHMDSIAKSENTTDGINMMFFVDATGGENSGGLTLSWDNEMKDVIFEPQNLRNSVLIYNTFVDFYHGFPPIAKGKSRRTIGVSFNDRT